VATEDGLAVQKRAGKLANLEEALSLAGNRPASRPAPPAWVTSAGHPARPTPHLAQAERAGLIAMSWFIRKAPSW
jgi:hypothetical protein